MGSLNSRPWIAVVLESTVVEGKRRKQVGQRKKLGYDAALKKVLADPTQSFVLIPNLAA